MNLNEAFPSAYVREADLKGREVRLTIKSCQMEDIGGDHKPVLYFERTEKGLVLNKTNANTIAGNLGSYDSDHWTGKTITLTGAETEFQGKRVRCIRVKLESSQRPVQVPQRAPVVPQRTPEPAPTPPDEYVPEDSDDMPF